jgi:hypothetical protein
MNPFVRGLTWPIISLLIVGGSHLVAELARPSLAAVITPPAVAPLYLAVGAWAGVAVVGAGGTFVHGVVAGAILGLLPVVLQIVGFGMILGREPDAALTAGLFGFVALLWGGILGAGYAQPQRA